MSDTRDNKKDFFSAKLFFLILGGIAAYNLSNWMSSEPEWEEMAYESGAFFAKTAGKSDLRKLREDLPFGEVEFQYLMFARNDVQYAISYGEIPVGVGADSATVSRRDRMLSKMEGEMLAEEMVEMSGHPARQTKIRASDKSLLRLQSLQVGTRLYSLMAAGAPDAFDDNPDIALFFASFRLDGAK